MPNIKSAKKRVSIEARRRTENKYVKSTMATMIKKFRNLVMEDPEKAEKKLREITSYIDSAQSKGVIHKNTASRKISRLNILLHKTVTLNKEKENTVVKSEVKEPEKPEEKKEVNKEVKKETKKEAKDKVKKEETSPKKSKLKTLVKKIVPKKVKETKK